MSSPSLALLCPCRYLSSIGCRVVPVVTNAPFISVVGILLSVAMFLTPRLSSDTSFTGAVEVTPSLLHT